MQVYFWIVFFLSFWSSSGASGEPSWVFGTVLDGRGPPKNLKNLLFFKVFVNACFKYLESLNWPFGTHLALYWADLVPKKHPKMAPQMVKECPKMGQENDPNKSKQITNFAPRIGPQKPPRWWVWGMVPSCRSYLGSSWSQHAPQDGSRWP